MSANKTRTFLGRYAGGGVVLALCVALIAPALAADAVFPPGSRIGLVPPAGMVPSKSFVGFEDVVNDAAIVMVTLPAAAFAELDQSHIPETLKKEGISVEKREPIQLSVGRGFLVIGSQSSGQTRRREWLLVAAADDLTALVRVQAPEHAVGYTDSVVRATLATLAVRASVPQAEQLSLLPFTIGDLAGFRLEGIMPGRALTLIDPADGVDTRMLIAALPGGPQEADQRADFARFAFQEIGGIKDVRLTMSEPLRFGNQPGFQTMAQAKDAATGIDIMVAQWLRFGTGGFLQMIGMGRADNWPSILARLRTVRDSIELK